MTSTLSRLNAELSPAALFVQPPVVAFRSELTGCPHCGAPLKVLKTYRRRPVTLHMGPFIAQETVLCCDRCPDRPVVHSEELATLVAPGRTFGYDVMVYCGEAMLLRCCDAETLVADLAERNITISASEVRELTARFVVSLAIAQAEASPRLREQLRSAGGYVLHLDATGKGGSARLLTGIDEITGFVLLNAKIQSESADKLFADPIQVQTLTGPRLIQPQRTNNILERFFRRLGRDVAKRTGQKLTEGFLAHLLPDTPLVANLDKPSSVR